MARIVDFSVVGVDPDHMGWGPVPETEKVMAKTGLELSEMGLALKEKRDIVNVNGSGIALGRPVGATGTRLLVTFLYEMRRRNVQYGLATLCGGGGVAMATIIE